ncbi:MAG: type IV toxin-antitoxin system AbiEi family antitoxin domain-containing protein [Solirubrobacterales bacterium]|nr:type IV toxin-antitoxin system AbiEi family antitoxin domain-containing protein [Solirubrobacterales bacterium]
MGCTPDASLNARAWALANRQRGTIARRQLMALGFTRRAIEHRIARGKLHPVGHGVYVVGRRELTREGGWMAAILACGEGALLSHRSAGALYGITEERRGVTEVSVPRRGKRTRPGIKVHNRPGLRVVDIGTLHGIPVTSPVQTMLDLATVLGPYGLERTVNEADKREVIDPETLRMALDARVGEPGVRRLRSLLDRDTFLLSDSDLELLFRPIAAAAGLPRPLTKDWVNGFEVDFHWPGLGLVVETDGWRYHRTPAVQRRDAIRDQTHTAAGLTTLRFSHWQVKYDPGHVQAILAATATHLPRPSR